MMWFLITILLFAVRDSVCESEAEDCLSKERRVCDVEILPNRLPESTEELQSACHNTTIHARCVLDVKKECSEPKEELLYFQKLIHYLEVNCEEDSPIFQVISRNILCLKDALIEADNVCHRRMSERNQKAIFDHQEVLVENSIYINDDNSYCVSRSWRIQCPTIIIGLECGTEAKDAVSEILQELSYHFEPCRGEVFAELSTLDGIYEEILIEERNLKNAIKEDK